MRAFFAERLKGSVSLDASLHAIPNTRRMKRFLGRVVEKIASQLYETIRQEADRLTIYTWEIRSDSKAHKIFMRRQFTFEDEDVLLKELLIFFVNSERMTGHLGYIKRIEPLSFDPGLEAEYIQSLASDEKKLEVLDELEALYGELERPGERLAALEPIGEMHVYFDTNQTEDEESNDHD